MFTIIVDISVTFRNLGFYDKSKPCIAVRPVITSRNHGSSLDEILYAQVGHRYSLILCLVTYTAALSFA